MAPSETRTGLAPLLSRVVSSTLPGDDPDDLPRATLVVGTWVILVLAVLWVSAYLVLGRPGAALIPFIYQLLSLATLWGLRRGRIPFPLARSLQLWAMLVLPFLLHATLSGFIGSGGVAMWALCTPMLAFLYGASPGRWLGGYAALALLAGILEPTLRANAEPLTSGAITTFFVLNTTGLGAVIYVGILYATGERERRRRELLAAYAQVDAERARGDGLLANLMPADIARRLKRGEQPIADRLPAVTVLAADVVGFTPLTARLGPERLVEVMDRLWTRFDRLALDHGLEKIKSVGDSYLVVGGLVPGSGDQAEAVAEMALAMREPMIVEGIGPVQVRIGIDRGPATAGVIGSAKLTFGLWGDAVNVASRMESTGIPGEVQVTERVRERLSHGYVFESRGTVEIAGKGPMETHLLRGSRRDVGIVSTSGDVDT